MSEDQQLGTTEAELIKARRAKLDALRSSGRDPFAVTRYERTHEARQLHAEFGELKPTEHTGQTVRAAGRLGTVRWMGKKAVFSDLSDQSGRIQLYFRADTLGDEFALVETLDRGDLAGVEGEIFATKTGELTIAVKRFAVLSKSLRPLPEKWHGLTDHELRYRRRYVDLIVNRPVLETMLLRSRLIAATRRYLDDRGYVEVETPVLLSIAGGANARPFVTHSNALDISLQMRIATELNLKRCIVGGIEKVYELGRIFRNEGIDRSHNPEFTMLELYQAYGDVNSMMELSEDWILHLAAVAGVRGEHHLGGETIALERPFARIAYLDAMKKWGGLERADVLDEQRARAVAARLKLALVPDAGHPHVIDKIFEAVVEPQLVNPTFVTDFPVVLSPLAKRRPDDRELVERFELFIGHMEIVNAFSELNDPDDQRTRFEAQAAQRARGDQEAPEPDWDYVHALEYGMPPTGGLGSGIDRLVMLLSGERSIQDVLLFPMLKPE
ncbi:MAG: lysine--tRNA ligase [Candidatus Eremiobacteraeota bacterium]|nr:lysine--tRNA ligase [Candidatus Eremiobacteraeota bacterium]